MGGIILYIREDIPSKRILTKKTTAVIFAQITLRKKSGSFAVHITQKSPFIKIFEQNWQNS